LAARGTGAGAGATDRSMIATPAKIDRQRRVLLDRATRDA
jgi:hypothetical protein